MDDHEINAGPPTILSVLIPSPGQTVCAQDNFSCQSTIASQSEKKISKVFSKLTEDIKKIVKKERYLETHLPRCKLVSEGFYQLLSAYNPLIIHSKSNMISSISVGYDHWFLQINIENDTFILDGTYRQFFEGESYIPGYIKRRLLLPGYFLGNIEELYMLFNTNRDMLMPVFFRNLQKKHNVLSVCDTHIADLIDELYGRCLILPTKPENNDKETPQFSILSF